ncbi:DUF5689 domain-containing protein [Ancylomarina sp. DW003]|nr:DUF5689 domain-containing protein [Ancylomarina sp. DW003]MDE5423459.1 DUF5689 domain-containing protein [Ancylomarina sp. DW003]
MRKLHYLVFALILGLSVSFTSCSSDDDDAPVVPGVEFPEVKSTLAALKALATGNDGVGVEISDEIVLEGTVVTDPATMNLPKSLFIQVGDAAIKLSVDDSGATFKSLQVGQRVFLKAQGLYIGVSYDVPVIGASADDKYKVGLISDEKLKEVLTIDTETVKEVTPKVVTIADVASPLAMVGTVVSIEGVQFAKADQAKSYYFGENSYATTNLIDAEGNKIAISTYKTATFGSEAVKGANSGTVTAVLSIYSGKPQLVLRSVADLNFTATLFEEAGEPDATTDSKVYFSEYTEGSSNNKFVEIYNASGAEIDLANYTIRSGSNGGDWSDAIELTGKLADKAIYVIGTDQLDASILEKADLKLAYPSPAHFNGNDAVGLFKKVGEKWSLCDVVGVQGEDPGKDKGWTVATVENATMDHTLIRKEATTVGNPDWTTAATEWVVKDKDYWGSIGIRGEGEDNGGNEGGNEEATGINAGDTNASGASDLFISEYVEGGSSNKYLEIFNGTGADVDLSGYSIILGVNGKAFSEGTPLALSGTLPNGATFLIANSSAALTLPEGKTANVELSKATWFNGDDAIGLFKGDALIDIFGVVGEDPGKGWEVNGTANATVDHTFVRKATVTSPVTTWDTAEWEILDKEVITNLGSHTMN